MDKDNVYNACIHDHNMHIMHMRIARTARLMLAGISFSEKDTRQSIKLEVLNMQCYGV